MSRADCSRLAVMTALLCGCSLVVDDHEFPQCNSHSDCDALNTADGIGRDVCERWQCDGALLADASGLRSGRCVLRPRDDDSDGQASAQHCKSGRDCDDSDARAFAGATERCDGRDNDCDGVIDERAGDRQVIEASRISRAPIDENVTWIAYAFDPDATAGGPVALWVAGAERPAAHVVSLDDNSSSDYALRVPEQNDQSFVNIGAERLRVGCFVWSAANPRPILAPVCDPIQSVIGFAGEARMSAAVAQLGDVRGQIRVGYARGSDPPGLIMRGPAVRANSYLGIDVDASGRTTGASRAGSLGAARPALAVLDSQESSQALVAWIGDRPARGECAGPEVDVEAVVAFLQAGTESVPAVNVTTQANGTTPSGAARVEARMLGTTLSGVGPAVTSLQDRGYLVAHDDAAGALQLQFVPRPAVPAEFVRCWDEASCTPDDVPRDMPAIEGVMTWTVEPLAQTTSGIALRVGEIRGDAFELGVAWREGCGTDHTRIAFQRLVFRTRAGSIDLEPADEADRFWIDAGDGSYGQPSIAYVESGFLRPDPAGTSASSTGGWTVAWADRSNHRVLARRIAARHVQSLDGDAPLVLADRVGMNGAAMTDRPWLYNRGASDLGFAYFDSDSAAIASGRLSCSDSN